MMIGRRPAVFPVTGQPPSPALISLAATACAAARPIRVLIADALPLFRCGARQVLHSQPDCEVVGEAASAEQTLALLRELSASILLLDFSLPGSAIELLGQLRGASVRTVIVAEDITRREVANVMKLDACGIISKNSEPELLLKCVRSVSGGELWLGRHDVAAIVHALSASPAPAANRAGLTPRERQIIELVATGESNRGLAHLLAVSEDTIKHHLTNIFDKIGVSNRLELTLYAQRHDLVKMD
jgi:two-component system, NarL family, nitrate/nitrite response regulator NarL